MKREKSRAYISIGIIVTILVVSIICIFVSLLITQNVNIIGNTNKKRQAQYIAEGNIKYAIENLIGGDMINLISSIGDGVPLGYEKLPLSDLEYTSEQYAKKVYANNIPILKIVNKTEYEGVSVNVAAYLNIFYDFLLSGEGIVNHERLSDSGRDELDTFFNGVDDLNKSEDNIFKKTNGEATIYFDELNTYMKTGDVNYILSNAENNLITNDTLHIGNGRKRGKVQLNSVLICNSDLVLHTDFDFNGVLVLRGGSIITNGYDCVVDGLVIADKNSSAAGIAINGHGELILKNIFKSIVKHEVFYNPYTLNIKLNERTPD